MQKLSHVQPCDPMDSSPPGCSAHGIFQARILVGLPFPSPADLPDPHLCPVSSALVGGFSITALPGKPFCVCVYIYI